ncbi:uncharacterized protein BDCG_07925 [Blastomyces dermatitidis ER-3]|uniref:Uncharacterized protein n=3 Tax=Blastomyces TaxID=229219 RepID=A0A179UP50_BLAGS|nr:uncharacterized protein BDBG_04160 [Blastomyces gilchristii SLH14081]XP_045272575.1 uncharacterized protein BDCG_07925 [Blastomyces dermatitidis ER-3]EGE84572.2 hypothetical protein BDDG_07517 [Blastomyces dermatitidis ATCC 18188]EQL30117.1 hypothetical protein BDFG_07305 [Blastomyces dermatitidis ATCC 26199]EEQ84656.2 hypothetical protein BDCG_07925 [Blastomyces dermatitidis ER-3]OAT08182.1 hypothetical protein BDBG_04160 [Blastomyces gilchristii SLH14081]
MNSTFNGAADQQRRPSFIQPVARTRDDINGDPMIVKASLLRTPRSNQQAGNKSPGACRSSRKIWGVEKRVTIELTSERLGANSDTTGHWGSGTARRR